MSNTKKSSETITFRLEASMDEQWKQALKATGMNDGELVRACIQDGFASALKRVMKERRKAEEKLVRGAGIEPAAYTVSRFGTIEMVPGFV